MEQKLIKQRRKAFASFLLGIVVAVQGLTPLAGAGWIYDGSGRITGYEDDASGSKTESSQFSDTLISSTPATCTSSGEERHRVQITNVRYSGDSTQTLEDYYTLYTPALGHDYDSGVVTKKPTETEPGIMTYTCQRPGCGHTRTEEIPVVKHTHDWNEPTYEWTDDNSQCTATRECSKANCPIKTETETVDTTYEVTKAPTTAYAGEGTYTAEFTNEAFETQTRTVEIPKLEPTPVPGGGGGGHTPSLYIIKFDSNGGSEVPAQNTVSGTPVKKPEDPTKPGFKFKYWHQQGKETEFDFTKPVYDSITLVAEWERVANVVTLDTGSGEPQILEVAFGDKPSLPVPESPDGKIFDCWLVDGVPYDPSQPLTGDITLTAKWKDEAVCEQKGTTLYAMWNTYPGAENYTVYITKNGKLSRTVTTDKTKLNLTGLKNNGLYELTIVPNVNGEPVDGGDPYKAKINVKVKPEPKVTAKKNVIDVKWDSINGAKKYRVYKYVNGKKIPVTETKKTHVIINKSSKTSQYTLGVEALIDGKWTTLKYSDLVTVKTK